jgi:predicted transposase YbfD/YdcC
MIKTFIKILGSIEDTRTGNALLYPLVEVLVIAVVSVLCGMDHFTEMEMFGLEQINWFKNYLELKNGIPTHDTFANIFAFIKPEEINRCFSEWVETSLRKNMQVENVSIDGKTVRCSKDVPNNKKAIHVVSAWAQKNRLILGEIATKEKSNEITAIPKLLEMLELEGCTVTIDAMGTQTRIAKKIIEKGANYMLPVKENQPTLLENIKLFFDQKDIEFGETEIAKTSEKSHGRIETRECVISKNIDWLYKKEQWENLSGIAKVTSTRTILSTGKTETAEEYLIFSNKNATASQILESKRSHWGVEIMHWMLDICFNEDKCRVRKNHAAKIFNVIRHLVLNLLLKETSSKGGIVTKRKRCAISTKYREQVLGF